MSKMYTRAGDKGMTALLGGQLVSKANLRIASYGTLDELNALVGLIRSERNLDRTIDAFLHHTQQNLFILGAILANPSQSQGNREINFHAEEATQRLEAFIDKLDAQLPELTKFILPGGMRSASLIHVARTITRRAERLIVALHESEPVDIGIVSYMNRLSSAFFVSARYINFKNHVKDEEW